MSSKYYDTTAAVQVIGNVYKNPSLLEETDKYTINDEDFSNPFHRLVFGCIYKLYELGAKKITIENIVDFLADRPKYEAEFKQNKGDEWLLRAAESAIPDSFGYYYNRLKKFTLLRAYDSFGLDVKFIYDPDNILDAKKKQLQEDYLDNNGLNDIVQTIDEKIEAIKIKYADNVTEDAVLASEGIFDLIEELKKNPEVGIPMYGSIINTVTMGARLGKFYLRSAPSGVGKSRTMAADVCYIGATEMYEPSFGGWIKTGAAFPVLYISTELDITEVQTMFLSFLSGVNEFHILTGKYKGDEYERVMHAAQLLKESKIYVECQSDFSLQDVEDIIRKNIREHDTRYIFHDYIHTSMKILEEITRRSGGVKLREDQILFILSVKLKDICNQLGVFILSSTQLNGDYVESTTPDQNLLRGSKAIADKIDVGMIMLPVTEADKEKLSSILASTAFEVPNIKISVYKNRRGRYKGIYMWCRADLGICRIEPMFVTDYGYELQKVEDLKILTDEDIGGAF